MFLSELLISKIWSIHQNEKILHQTPVRDKCKLIFVDVIYSVVSYVNIQYLVHSIFI